MNTKKTCGECKHFEVDVVAATCEKKLWISDDNTPACKKFERKPITNGDVIRQGNNRKLAEIFGKLDNGNKCKYCIHRTRSGACELNPTPYSDVGYVDAEDCLNGFEAWLNAPAEIEDNSVC